MQEFVTIPTYLIEELPIDKFYALADFLSMADENREIRISTPGLMKRWKWGNTKVRNFIDYLIEKDICKQADKQEANRLTNKRQTKVFVVNTEFLAFPQTKNKQINKSKTNNKKASEQSAENQKQVEGPKRKSVRKEQIYYPNDEKLNQAFLDFMEMRKSIKKPMTDRAVTRAMNMLQKLAGNDNDLAIQILEQSIYHCWQDVYELKEDRQNNSYVKNSERDILSEWRNS